MRALCCMAVLAGLGCSHDPAGPGASPPAPQASAAPTSPDVAAGRSPIKVEWVVKSASANRTVLVARVLRMVPSERSLEVTVSTPPGVRLASGPSHFSLPGSAEGSVIEQEITVEHDGPPTAPLILEADLRGDGFGAHAKRAYRFGLAEPPAIDPPRQGPSVKIGGHDLGPAIPARPGEGR